MHIKMPTEYAIRVIVYLYERDGELVSAVELAEKLEISRQYLMRVIEQLKYAGIVKSVRGRYGGFKLMCDIEQITIYQVIRAMQGELRVNRTDDEWLGNDKGEKHSGQRIFELIQEELVRTLEAKSVLEIVE